MNREQRGDKKGKRTRLQGTRRKDDEVTEKSEKEKRHDPSSKKT